MKTCFYMGDALECIKKELKEKPKPQEDDFYSLTGIVL